MEPAENQARVAHLQGQCKVFRQILSPELVKEVAEYMKQNG